MSLKDYATDHERAELYAAIYRAHEELDQKTWRIMDDPRFRRQYRRLTRIREQLLKTAQEVRP